MAREESGTQVLDIGSAPPLPLPPWERDSITYPLTGAATTLAT